VSTNSDELLFARAEFSFSQKGNTLGTTVDYEHLAICVETQLPGDPAWFVLKSETGWSLNGWEEMEDLVKKVVAACEEVGARFC